MPTAVLQKLNLSKVSIYVDCVNCGKQNLIDEDDPYDVRCEYSGRDGIPAHAVRIKEGAMVETTKNKDLKKEMKPKLTIDYSLPPGAPVPPRPAGKSLAFQYYEEHRPDILADREKLGEKGMLKRWNISQASWLVKTKTGRWYGLAVRWGIEKSPVEPKRMGRPWPGKGKVEKTAGGGIPRKTPERELSIPEVKIYVQGKIKISIIN